jgi:hypothetical protein
VTWDSQGGSDAGVWLVKRGTVLKDVGKVLPSPTKSGFSFNGWWTKPQVHQRGMNGFRARTWVDEGEQIDENFKVVESVTFYAHWEEIKSSESRLASRQKNQEVLVNEGVAYFVPSNDDYQEPEDILKYQMVETVRNINRFESSIKHKPNVFSVVVENSNLAPDDSDSRDERLEDFKKHLRDSVS